ncbi:TPA: hypothetical protein VB415_001292, partial [Streptococcus pyogenes]|nr:hypothetical protein [Streptococcus pyogenes]HEP1364386.1 hypothetical protein [Streptococcus pyogenes]HER2936199.1 hypothetical protein [Streptococcus pyogenes]
MNKLKGKFRAWKSGKHWMYAGTMVIIATGMCTAKVTLADTSALEKQGNNNNDGRAYLNREEENNRSQFAQGSQDGYDDAKNGKDRRQKQSESDYTLGYDYGYSYGQKEHAKQAACEESLESSETDELDRVDVQFEEENNRSQFAQGSQDGYDDAKNGKDRRQKQSESDYTLGYDYGYD